MDRQLSTEGLEEDKKYFLNRRNKNLDRFNDAIKGKLPLEKISELYDNLVRSHKQYLLIDDALAIYQLTNNNNKK